VVGGHQVSRVVGGHVKRQAGGDGVLPRFAGLGCAEHRACLLVAACHGVSDDGDLSAVEHARADPFALAEVLARFVLSAGGGEGVGAGAEQDGPEPRPRFEVGLGCVGEKRGGDGEAVMSGWVSMA